VAPFGGDRRLRGPGLHLYACGITSKAIEMRRCGASNGMVAWKK
jgi:hypothetical protein